MALYTDTAALDGDIPTAPYDFDVQRRSVLMSDGVRRAGRRSQLIVVGVLSSRMMWWSSRRSTHPLTPISP